MNLSNRVYSLVIINQVHFMLSKPLHTQLLRFIRLVQQVEFGKYGNPRIAVWILWIVTFVFLNVVYLTLKMSEELLLIAGVVIGVLIIFRTYVRGARCKSKEKLHGKTVIVTGRTRHCILFRFFF